MWQNYFEAKTVIQNGDVKEIYVDIDGTICTQNHFTEDGHRDYTKAEALPSRIEKINALYDMGHKITYWTARGCTSGIDWQETTIAQLTLWGAKYHGLIVGDKPHYDLYIDDKSVNADRFFTEVDGN